MRIILSVLFLALFNLGFAQDQFDVAAVEKFQKELNAEYADAKTSPLMAEDLAVFKALDFYPINEKFFVTAKFIRTENEKPFEMKTSTTRKPMYVKYGEAHFEIFLQPRHQIFLGQNQNSMSSKKPKSELFSFFLFEAKIV